MNLEEKIKSQRIIIVAALLLISLLSFNLAAKGPRTFIAVLLGLAFLGMACFVFFGLKKKNKKNKNNSAVKN